VTRINAPRLLLAPSQVAHLLHVSPQEVADLAETGALRVAARTPGGHRRYELNDVLALRNQREQDQQPEKAL
jgi:DNA-binding transcriptional MerR regulator